MFSFGIFSFFAARIAVRKRGLEFGSPPPMRAAIVISRMIRVKTRPRFASVAAFLCLIVAHFECPDMTHPRLFHVTAGLLRSSMEEFLRRMAEHPSVDVQVAYCTLRGAEAGHDPEFGANIQWDVPLLDGYSWTHVPNRGSGAESFFGLFNPGLWKLIRGGEYDAVVSYVGYVRASFWVALASAKLSKAAFIFGTDAVSLTPRDGPAWKSKVKRFLWPRLFRLADQVIAPSAGTRELMRTLNIPPHR